MTCLTALERYVVFWTFNHAHFMSVKARLEAEDLQLEQVPGAITFELSGVLQESLDGGAIRGRALALLSPHALL